MQMTGELPEIKKQLMEKERQALGHLALGQAKNAHTQPGMNIIPKIIRMKELSVGDYYTGSDREKDEKAI